MVVTSQKSWDMKINKIEITNFKGFQHESIQFHGNLTVVIGNNTAGKTTLLHAVQVGLGAYLQSLSDLPGGKPYRKNFVESDRFLKYNPNLKDYLPNKDLPRIDIDAEFTTTSRIPGDGFEFKPEPVSWYREFTKSGSTTHNQECAGQLIRVVREMEAKHKDENEGAVYPLVLSFGTNRIDAQFRTARKTKERQQRIEVAYKASLDDEKVDFAGALDWLRRYEKNVRDGKEFEGTRNAYLEALATAIPSLSEIEIDNEEIEAVVTVDGKEPSRHHYSYMSDGLKSMINIVSEIAYRCIELNGFLGKDAVKQTPGVVLIDEVDLYLHPRWQQHILQDLCKAFPKIQFIVSTHSPFIVQSLDADQLISFDEGTDISGQPYREGLEDISSTRMGMKQDVRSKLYNRMLKAASDYFEALDAKKENADALLEELRKLEAEFSADPAYLALIRNEFKSKTAKK